MMRLIHRYGEGLTKTWAGLRAEVTGWQQRRQSARRLAEAARDIGGSNLSRQAHRPDRLFDAAFELNAWQGIESRSGRGSDLDNTEAIRRALPPLLVQLGVRSLLDIPCGDFHWMQHTPLPLERYIGADRVSALIARNRQLHAAPTRAFILCDVTRDPLPRCDLVLCRDLLVHLSYADIRRALRNIHHSGSQWLLTTQFNDPARVNTDIVTGDWRALNLCRPPFSLPPPRLLVDECYTGEDGQWRDKQLGLWPVSDLA